MHRLLLRLAALLCVFVLVAACSDSDTDLDTESGSGDDSSTTEPEGDDEEADEDAEGDDSEAADDDAESEAVADAEQALQAQGFSPEGATCMVESLLSSGILVEDLEQVNAVSPDQEILDAAADAGAACAALIADDLPEGVVDLSDPTVREQFVRTFSAATGLTTEQADCVAQHFIDNDVDYDKLIDAAGGTPDPETQQQVNAAVESCA